MTAVHVNTPAVVLFWSSALLIAFAYAGYPVLIHLLSRMRPRRSAPRDHAPLPQLSLVVPAYNEAAVLDAKVANCLALDYPRDRLQVLMASDGSTDGTAAQVRAAATTGLIRGLVFDVRRGKASVLNDLIRAASGDIIVFSDATSMLAPGSLRALASNFADARVGCVSGVYRVTQETRPAALEPESAYWRYETFIRQSESDLGTMLGAHGSMYAIRRKLYEPLHADVINDDFVIPLTILLNGYDCIYEPRAVASEQGSEMEGFARRIRIMTGNVQQLIMLLRKPQAWRRPLLLFQLMSHKALRLLIPFCAVIMFASSIALLERGGIYAAAFAAQTLFFVSALLGVSARMRSLGRAFIAAPYYVCMLNAAALFGLYRTLVRGGAVAWKAH